jgi:Flp pilus assembly protein TadG
MKPLKEFPNKQKGVAAVEFALIATLFFMLLLGVVEFGRVLFTWNAAVEATRYGARVAAVCNMNDAAIRDRMRRILGNLSDEQIEVKYYSSASPGVTECNTPATCSSTGRWVRVSISGYSVQTYIPIVGTVLNAPPFTTTLPRESMDSNNNPVCT